MIKKLKKVPSKQSKRIREPTTLPVSPEDKHPVFSLQHLRGRFCLTKCDKTSMAAFAKTLRKLSRMTWAQIRQDNKHARGYEFIPLKQLRTKPPMSFATKKQTMVFRFNGKAPMAGFREDQTYHVVWLDPKFKLYDHGD